MNAPAWRPDLLAGFECRDVPLAAGLRLHGEDALTATLVRRTLDADPERDHRTRAVLSLPGWNDYFFHTHVAEFYERLGFTFYALDPRRSGRSLRDPDYRDYVEDLGDVFEEIDAALDELAARFDTVVLQAHSTGGLTAALYAAARPGRLAGLVLNSPWLAMWGVPGYGPVLIPPLTVLTKRDPLYQLKLGDPADRYYTCIHADAHGEWDYDTSLKSPGIVPIRAGWIRGILRGHAQVARGLAIDAPVFLGLSTRSFLKAKTFSTRARTSDIVLDVANIAAKAPKLGRCVTLVRIENGFHDLTLAVPDARTEYLFELRRWLDAYVPPAVAL